MNINSLTNEIKYRDQYQDYVNSESEDLILTVFEQVSNQLILEADNKIDINDDAFIQAYINQISNDDAFLKIIEDLQNKYISSFEEFIILKENSNINK